MGLEINPDFCALWAAVITWMSETPRVLSWLRNSEEKGSITALACPRVLQEGTEQLGSGHEGFLCSLQHKALPSSALPSVSICHDDFCDSYRKMLDTCGDAENKLAMELSQHEVQIEREVLDPLCLLTEVRQLTWEGNTPGLMHKLSRRGLCQCWCYKTALRSPVLVVESGYETYNM